MKRYEVNCWPSSVQLHLHLGATKPGMKFTIVVEDIPISWIILLSPVQWRSQTKKFGVVVIKIN